ncbi:MAG: T9SS type A sorting domain-containing protein [Bacteroidia bacterium]
MTKTITIYTFTSGIGISASPSSICTGFSSTLTASNGVSGYTWQPSGTGTTIVVSPTITTTYTVTGVTSNGCTRTNTITVTVNNPSTLTISPATSNTICLNSSINLSASGATTYTWQPMNTPGSGITVSPTVATTYTVFGTNSFGCIGSKTVTVFVNSLPTVNCSTSNTTTCPGLTATLSASGASTYTWLPSTISSTVAVSPTVTTSYTVIGTSVLDCTNSCILTQSVFPTTVNFFTIVSTPSVICTLFPYNVTATLSVVGTPNYTWLPSGPSNTIITTTAPGIFSATATYTNGCIYTKTLNLAEPGPDPALNLIKVCNGSTLNLTSYTSPSGGTYSLNGVASSNTVGPLSPGTYTVNFTYTAGVVCNPNLTSTFVVLPTVVTPTISTTSTLICQTIPTITLTALPSTQSYTWLPMYSTGYTVAASPTVNTIYTVQVGTDALGNCGQTSTISIITSTAPCNCVNGCNTSLSGNLTTSPATNSVYCVTNNIQINGTVTFSNSDFRIYPLMSITIYSNAVLTITGSHLYSCDNMWQGIIVQQGGKLIINDGTRSSFIEDAYVAVDVYTTSTTYTATSILSVDNVTFNRNQIGIRIGDYTTSQSTYPFSIQNCLFTSRSIPFSALSYTNNTTIKNSASGNSSPLQTPYVSNSLYASANLKAPLATDYPSNGIVLNSVGYTIAYGNNWYGLAIGNSTNSAKFNCFDNLKEDITAYNTNVLISNNVFQNGVRYGRGSSAGGKAIVANSANVANNLAGARNNQIMINSVASTTNLGNYFYEKTGCADINGYINIEIKNNYVYSYANNYNLFTTLNAIGDHGFSVVTNRYLNITMQYNNIYNIKNAMLVGIDNSGYWNALGSSSTGRLVGNVTCSYNLVDRHPSTPSSAEFVNIGFSLDDPFSAATTTIVGSNSNVIQFNRMQNVHNAIAASNIAFCPVYAYSNTITMVNEPNTYYTTPIQTGINFTQILNTSKINKNNINGSSSPTYSPGVKAISTSGNAIMSVRCNTTAYTARGLEFNGVQTIDYLEDNTMSDQTYGFVLDNSAKLTSTVSTYVMGSASRPTNNVWLNSWTVNTKTGTFNSSSAQDGKLYVDFTSSQLDPNGSGYTDWIYGTTNYFHASHAASTLLNVTTTVTPSCRITGGGMGRMMNDGNDSNIVALLEQTTNDSIIFDEVSSEANFINKNTVYRTLKANIDLLDKSNSLSNFYASVQNSSLKNLSDIEEAFANSDLNSASTLIDGLNPSNAVETNYKNFYTIYKHTKDSTYNFNDSTLLSNLANACPYMSGGVVYQARAFYNILYTTYKVFYDNCNEVSARKANKPKQNIRVILKTEVYPNPNNGNYTIRFTNVLEKQNIEISIFDLSGKLLFKENKLISGNEINMSNNFINGAYTVKIKLPDGSYDLHKIIISK